MKLKHLRRQWILLAAGLAGWFVLMCSPVGHYVAIGTILALLVILFVIGVISAG